MSGELRMDAYYFSFDSTGARSIDLILSAVACAGKAFHSTSEWTEHCEAYMAQTKGNSCREWIQNAAIEAAAERAELLAVAEESLRFSPFVSDSEETPFLRRARAAIAKARGGR